MQKTTFLIVLKVWLLAVLSQGQTLKAYEKKAEETFQDRQYEAALKHNQVLLDVDSNRLDALFEAGQAAKFMRAFPLAEKYLSKIPDSLKTGDFTAVDFDLGIVNKGLGRYNRAIAHFRKYVETHRGELALSELAKLQIESCEWAMEMVQNPSSASAKRLSNDVNSTQSEFAPVRYADRLYFTSYDRADTSDNPLSLIFSSAQGYDVTSWKKTSADSGAHSSNLTLTVDARRTYFTICKSTEQIYEYECEIWFRERNYEGTWAKPKRLPNFINLDSANTTMPSIAWDRFLEKEVLYFATDRPGGKGGMDVWYSILEADGKFGKPICLPFNTPQDDITPFFHQATQTLFFSSEGMVENFGGFDIFRAVKSGADAWSKPKNLGYPLNGADDDLYYFFHSGEQQGYFASNRPGTLFRDSIHDRTCTDIYVAPVKIDLEAWTFSTVDSMDLTGARVELIDLKSGKSETFQVQEKGNKFSFPLELDRHYRIVATREDFMSARAEISTEGMSFDSTFRQNLYLRPGVELVVRTYDAIDSLPLGETLVELTHLGKSGEPNQPDGKKWQVQNDRFANQSHFAVHYKQKYHLVATKKGYSSGKQRFSSDRNNLGDTIFVNLYLSPFEGLPLVLYYDNARPLFVSPEDTTTELTYAQTLDAYFDRKETFLSGYSSGLRGREKERAQAQIESFFADSVMENFIRLQTFCLLLDRYLADDHNLEILFAGYASPLADSTYNKRLTARRVASLINHFKAYNGGVLVPYFDSGRLKILLDPRGEEYKPEVSDDPANRRMAEFSPEASRMRRVVITEIRSAAGEPIENLGER